MKDTTHKLLARAHKYTTAIHVRCLYTCKGSYFILQYLKLSRILSKSMLFRRQQCGQIDSVATRKNSTRWISELRLKNDRKKIAGHRVYNTFSGSFPAATLIKRNSSRSLRPAQSQSVIFGAFTAKQNEGQRPTFESSDATMRPLKVERAVARDY